MKMISILDYGSGNIMSLKNSLERIGEKPILTSDTSTLESSSGIIIPGVGSFDNAMQSLCELRNFLANYGKPLLGICLGMQILFESSEEGKLPGLGLVRGEVKRFENRVKVPQMGWNTLEKLNGKLFSGIKEKSFVYFANSYYSIPKDRSIISSLTPYNYTFTSSIEQDNIFGVQFHPEKSGVVGMQILKNFVEECK